jgi:U3 small nucleolar RNA-associated protein 12
MVNSYNKYGLSQTFGLVNSALSNVLSLTATGTTPGEAVVGANEHVLIWDVKKGELLHKWSDGSDAQVTALANSFADGDIFAVGYESTLSLRRKTNAAAVMRMAPSEYGIEEQNL